MRIPLIALVLGAALLACGIALAQDFPTPPPVPTPQSETWMLPPELRALKQQKLSEYLNLPPTRAAEIGPLVEQLDSAYIDYRTAQQAITERLRGRIAQRAPQGVRVTSNRVSRLTMKVTAEPLQKVIEQLGTSTGYEVVADYSAKADSPVTIELDGASMEDALGRLTASAGFQWAIVDQTLFVGDLDALAKAGKLNPLAKAGTVVQSSPLPWPTGFKGGTAFPMPPPVPGSLPGASGSMVVNEVVTEVISGDSSATRSTTPNDLRDTMDEDVPEPTSEEMELAWTDYLDNQQAFHEKLQDILKDIDRECTPEEKVKIILFQDDFLRSAFEVLREVRVERQSTSR